MSFLVAQNKVPMSIVDLINVSSIGSPQISPDGNFILYTLSEANWDKNKRISHIWRVNKNGKNKFQMTQGENGESSPTWSPSGESFAFISKRGSVDDENNQIYLISNLGGEATKITNHHSSVSNIQWSPDGKNIYFLASDPKSDKEKEKDDMKDDVYAFDENYKQRHLWKVNVENQNIVKITNGDFSITNYKLSRDGRKIAFHRGPNPLYGYAKMQEVWAMNSDGKAMVQITENDVPESGAKFSPDNSKILFTSFSDENFEFYFNDNLFVTSSNGANTKLLLKKMPHEVNSAEWSKDGKSIIFHANTGLRTELFQVTVSNQKLKQLTKGDHSVSSWNYAPKLNQVVFKINSPTNSGDLYLANLNKKFVPKKVTNHFDYLNKKYLLPNQEAISWKGEDGVKVEGLLYYPLNYKKGEKYPLVVQTHGGPASSDKFGFGSWSRYVQVLTARGWIVLKPNYRGSTGYGDEFLRDMVGSYFNQSHLDVMTGVDNLINKGMVNEDRMVKMGWSAGGHMTNKIITFTDRFKAASSGAGAVNWISMYAQSDVRTYRTPWFGGTPWEKNAPIDNYWNNSPLKDIYQVKTPTIILVGEKDPRVPMPQSVELYRALKSNNVPTHLYVAPREPHGWRELHHELSKVNIELEWFEKYALNKKYEWELAPNLKDKND
jgi:dipeptidyl aminopeptidase/acylaminoacyl peptidase